jgi:hypothetical protein
MAHIGTDVNAYQPRSQVLGANDLPQVGLQLDQFSAKRPDVPYDQGGDLHGDRRLCGVIGEVDSEPTATIATRPNAKVAPVVERNGLLDVLGHLRLGLAGVRAR